MRARRVLESEFGEKHKVDVANVIPPQSAARIAIDAGLADAVRLGAGEPASPSKPAPRPASM